MSREIKNFNKNGAEVRRFSKMGVLAHQVH